MGERANSESSPLEQGTYSEEVSVSGVQTTDIL